MFCVVVFCGSDLFIGVCVYVCVCVGCIVLIVCRYALFSYMHIKSFCFLHVNRQNVPLCYVASGRCVYKLFPFPHPLPPAAIVLGAISIDVV